MKREMGFTLVELVIVIAILGILAAFAIPRFVSLTSDARISSVEALAGNVRAAAALAHATSIAKRQTPTATVTMDGNVITMIHHYPVGAADGIEDTLSDTSGFTITHGSPAGTTTFTRDGATDGTECKVDYAQPTGANLAPTITIDTDGC